MVESRKTLLVIRRLYSGSDFDECGNEKRLVNINATTGVINDFHSQKLFTR